MFKAGPEGMQRMAGKEKVMAVLMGPVEVRQTFRDWPAEMCLAVCLMDNGDCQLVVFRQEEVGPFPRRLQQHLGLNADELCFFPAAPGFPTRTLLYSDERRLMALVSEAPEIVEEASDYSVNYAYALEEGLNPAVFLGIEVAGTRPEPAPERGVDRTAPGDMPSGADFVSRRAPQPAPEHAATGPARAGRVRKALLPGFMQRVEQAQPGARFRSARELALSEERPVLCEICPEQNGWIMVARIGEGGADIRIGDPDLIYLRDDHSVVAIRLEPPWDISATLPGRIWIRAKSLPPSLRTIFTECVGSAEMTGNGAFLYLHVAPQLTAPASNRADPPALNSSEAQVTPDAAPRIGGDEAAEPVTPAPRQGKYRIRRRLLALTGIAAALVLIQLGLQVGFQLGGQGAQGPLGGDAQIDWDRFRSVWQAARAG
ncbi:hypothetical protein [Antarcticimicrobium luteum]|uniref:Uncharacterized protein n=1 Tax=Antarcticimicrobium luteum TaxID=2547397 RepID=A0A4R5VEL0_9RHOB|nr:hypothetical protein [Antarcticimicrobium luteum]TDK50226.1 hypothetical protein E1832_07405 [Antarcticimicrobium luteum]